MSNDLITQRKFEHTFHQICPGFRTGITISEIIAGVPMKRINTTTDMST